MDTRGILIVFGSLAAIVAAIVCGARLDNGWGTALLIGGIVAGIAWLVGALQIMAAFNSDI